MNIFWIWMCLYFNTTLTNKLFFGHFSVICKNKMWNTNIFLQNSKFILKLQYVFMYWILLYIWKLWYIGSDNFIINIYIYIHLKLFAILTFDSHMATQYYLLYETFNYITIGYYIFTINTAKWPLVLLQPPWPLRHGMMVHILFSKTSRTPNIFLSFQEPF